MMKQNESFVTAKRDVIIGMLSVTVGAVANIILDPIFTFVRVWGIKVMNATVISRLSLPLACILFSSWKIRIEGDGFINTF